VLIWFFFFPDAEICEVAGLVRKTFLVTVEAVTEKLGLFL
jgi:hypothetical protein